MEENAICYETAVLHDAVAKLGDAQQDSAAQLHLQQPNATPTPEAAATNGGTVAEAIPAVQHCHFPTNEEKFQAEITKWEENYDQIQRCLSSNTAEKSMPKSMALFSISQDGSLYYTKSMKDGSFAYLKVVREYVERVRICREIHLDTGEATLHNRRDRMLEVLGQTYFWKGQRRDVCQCIASCEVCSAGLGAKRKAKPPGQKRDIPRSGPPDPPRKRAKIGRPRKSPQAKSREKEIESESRSLLENNLSNVLTSELAVASAITEIVGGIDQQQQQSRGGKSSPNLAGKRTQRSGHVDNISDLQTSIGTLDPTDVNFHQIFTTIEAETSDCNSPSLQESSQVKVATTEEVSIYELLFKLPSMPSNISASVVEAVHMAMKGAPDNTVLLEAAEVIMRQVLSLGQGYNVIISPTTASAYTIAVFASMLRTDPLSVSSQISSRLSSPLAVLHDSCCAQASNSELGPIKTCTALTGAYNWNLGDMTYPMDKDMVRMAVQSNRVAAVFYQPYAYIEKSQHIPLEVVSSVCHSRGSDVAIIVDASTMPTGNITLSKLVGELKGFLDQGADLVLMPSVDKLHGQSHASVLVGVSSLLSKVWRSIMLLQKQVCLPLLCLPHDQVGTVVAYKALDM